MTHSRSTQVNDSVDVVQECWKADRKLKAVRDQRRWYPGWKDLFDRCLAVVMTLCLLPLMIGIGIVIALDSPGNPLFIQERVGRGGRRFFLYKFRSMYREHDDGKYLTYIKKYVQENLDTVTDEAGNDIWGLIHDPRVTPTGRLLRRTSLDELPQLFNIIKGDMSFVGPRPDIPMAVDLYTPRHTMRLQVKPGLTGAWQVLPDRRDLSFDEVVDVDLDYIDHRSFFRDLKILWGTAFQMFRTGEPETNENKVAEPRGVRQ